MPVFYNDQLLTGVCDRAFPVNSLAYVHLLDLTTPTHEITVDFDPLGNGFDYATPGLTSVRGVTKIRFLGTAPDPLSANYDYYAVLSQDGTKVQIADSAANALAGYQLNVPNSGYFINLTSVGTYEMTVQPLGTNPSTVEVVGRSLPDGNGYSLYGHSAYIFTGSTIVGQEAVNTPFGAVIQASGGDLVYQGIAVEISGGCFLQTFTTPGLILDGNFKVFDFQFFATKPFPN